MNLDAYMYPWFVTVFNNSRYDQYRRRIHEIPTSYVFDERYNYEVIPSCVSVHFNDERKEYMLQDELNYLMSEMTPLERKLVEYTFLEGFSMDLIRGMFGLSKHEIAKIRRGALGKMQQKKQIRDSLLKKNDAPAIVLEDFLTQAS